MMTRSATRSPWEVDEFASCSSNGLVEIEAVFELDSVSNSGSLMVEVDSVSNSVSPALAEAAEAATRSDVEQVESRSSLEVEPISRGALPASLI